MSKLTAVSSGLRSSNVLSQLAIKFFIRFFPFLSYIVDFSCFNTEFRVKKMIENDDILITKKVIHRQYLKWKSLKIYFPGSYPLPVGNFVQIFHMDNNILIFKLIDAKEDVRRAFQRAFQTDKNIDSKGH